MYDIFCVTNRLLCNESFLSRINKIASVHPAGIILREKDLTHHEYIKLAADVIEICIKNNTPCILHGHTDAAKELGWKSLHLPFSSLQTLTYDDRKYFDTLGASCHSKEDAVTAEKLGCTYITAGHIFDTDCKKGLPGRGIDFLKNICKSVLIPVYAIGGIDSSNISAVRSAGAKGAFIMSGAMKCEDVHKYFIEFKEIQNEI